MKNENLVDRYIDFATSIAGKTLINKIANRGWSFVPISDCWIIVPDEDDIIEGMLNLCSPSMGQRNGDGRINLIIMGRIEKLQTSMVLIAKKLEREREADCRIPIEPKMYEWINTFMYIIDSIAAHWEFNNVESTDITTESLLYILNNPVSTESDLDNDLFELALEAEDEVKKVENKVDTKSKNSGASQDAVKDDKEAETDKVNFKRMIVRIKGAHSNATLKLKSWGDRYDIARNLIYHKNMGKIDSLYSQYGSTAMVVENKLRGDPVKLLTEEAGKYTIGLIDGINSIQTAYDKLMTSLLKTTDMDSAVALVSKFTKNSGIPIDAKSNPGKISKAMSREIRFRVGTIMLKDHDIYGHNVESILNKKYPKANELVVSIFLANPGEKPIKQPVSGIFAGPASFQVMGSKVKKIIFANSKLITAKATNVGVEKATIGYNKAIKDFKMSQGNDGAQRGITATTDTKQDLARVKSLIIAVKRINKQFIPLYTYCIDVSNNLFDLSIRLDTTTMTCIKALLTEEAKGRDTTTGIKVAGGVKANKKEYANDSAEKQ